jgi:hypothetical protein
MDAQSENKLSRFMIPIVIIGMVLIVIFGVIKIAMDARGAPSADAASIGNSLKLVAKPWNHGYVHLWADLTEGPNEQYKDIAEGTVCTKLDDESHVLGSGDTAIYYFKVNCNASVGFVEVDQAR